MEIAKKIWMGITGVAVMVWVVAFIISILYPSI